jgi:hypothetical protein
MRRITAVAAVTAFALLALPAAAPAKGVAALSVCGAGGACHAVDAAAVRAAAGDDFTPAAAPAAAGWYLVRAKALMSSGDVAEAWTAEWLLGAGVMRTSVADGEWIAPSPPLRAALRRAARGLRARPARALGPDVRRQARVVEVFSPADEQAAAERNGGAGAPAPAAGAGIAAALALAAAAVGVRRRRAPGRAANRHA